MLEKRLDLSRLRTAARGDDTELDTVLNAIRWTALQFETSANESQQRKPAKATVNWYTTTQVATGSGVTNAAIRLAVREGRLRATKVDGHWQIAAADYYAFRAHSRKRQHD